MKRHELLIACDRKANSVASRTQVVREGTSLQCCANRHVLDTSQLRFLSWCANDGAYASQSLDSSSAAAVCSVQASDVVPNRIQSSKK